MSVNKARSLEGTITADIADSLNAGEQILYTGTLYTARDAAHARLIELLDAGKSLPIDIENAIIYYAGPTPAKPGHPIGSCGPTSSYRMDPYTPKLLEMGLRAMIGKGARSPEVVGAIERWHGVYFAAIGGAGALIAKSVKSLEPVAYEDLGTEAIVALDVMDMPLTVAIDDHGGNIYEQGPADYLAKCRA